MKYKPYCTKQIFWLLPALLFCFINRGDAQQAPAPGISSIEQMAAAYSGNYEWDAETATLFFSSSGKLNFPGRTEHTDNIWHIPPVVKRVFINKNVTVTGQFTIGHDMVFEGEDKETSVVFGTPVRAVLSDAGLDDKYSCVAYSSFYSYHNGDVYIKNLTCLNPLGFMFTGKGGCRQHLDNVRGIDDRGGFSNHSDGISAADHSTVRNCYFATGDDAIKVYSDILVENTHIHMVQNCVPIQFGWGKYGNGATGIFKNLTITGNNGRGSNNGIIVLDSDDAGGASYKKTIVIDGCNIVNKNAELFRFDDNTIVADVSITNAYIDIEQFGAKYGKGSITICGRNDKAGFYNCADGNGACDGNVAPGCVIASPANGARFDVGEEITIVAGVEDENGNLNKVEFYANNTKLGEKTNPPFEFTVSNLYEGNYLLIARALDSCEAQVTSSGIAVVVGNPAAGYSGIPYFGQAYTVPSTDSLAMGWFDLGPQNEVINDGDAKTGKYLPGLRSDHLDEEPNVELTLVGGAPSIYQVENGEWWRYSVKVNRAGNYVPELVYGGTSASDLSRTIGIKIYDAYLNPLYNDEQTFKFGTNSNGTGPYPNQPLKYQEAKLDTGTYVVEWKGMYTGARPDLNYFRLLHIDDALSTQNTAVIPQVYPNPFSNSLSVNTMGYDKIEVFGMNGARIFTHEGKGKNMEVLFTENWPRATYIIQLTGESGVRSVKVVKL